MLVVVLGQRFNKMLILHKPAASRVNKISANKYLAKVKKKGRFWILL